VPSSLFSHDRLHRVSRLIHTLWIAYWCLLLGLTHAPKLPRIPLPLDRRLLIAHAMAFALLAWLCMLAARARRPRLTWSLKIKWFWVLAVYAACDEILQPLTHRHADVYDWIADLVGVAVVFSLFGEADKTGSAP